MAKDYASTRHQNKRGEKNRTIPYAKLSLVFITLIVFLGGGYYIYQQAQLKNPISTAVQYESKNVAVAPSDTTDAIEEPRFEFYRILPSQEVTKGSVDDDKTQTISNNKKRSTSLKTVRVNKAAAGPKSKLKGYVVQVASFKDADDANNFVGDLKEDGFSAHVTSITFDNTKWHRVYIGPYIAKDTAKKVQTKLQHKAYESIIRKLA